MNTNYNTDYVKLRLLTKPNYDIHYLCHSLNIRDSNFPRKNNCFPMKN